MRSSNVTKEHLVGVAVGIGLAAGAIYLYKKNQSKVDEFLRNQGINIKPASNTNFESMNIENLTELKEHIEDLIAEKSMEETAEEVIIEEK